MNDDLWAVLLTILLIVVAFGIPWFLLYHLVIPHDLTGYIHYG